MPERVLIDTNIAVYLATGHALALRYWAHFDRKVLSLSFATAAELLYTARRAKNPTRTLAYWRERFRYYEVLFPDVETCEIWAQITADCARRGHPKQDNDLWIAATALRHDIPLVTHNRRDFEDVVGLTVISEAPSRS